jgi:formyltetrahydrofolate synthetase
MWWFCGTVRALKMHGGGPKVVAGKPLDQAYTNENLPLLKEGLSNLLAHISIARKYGIPVGVAVNSFATDTEAELNLVREAAIEQGGASAAVVSRHWELGGEGARELAEAAWLRGTASDFKFLIWNAASKKKSKHRARVYGQTG